MTVALPPPRRVRHAPRLRLAEVRAVLPLTPRMRRVVLGGDALDGFTSLAADDHVKLFFPSPGEDRPLLPEPGPDGLVFPDGAARPVTRDYTPRAYDAARRTLTIDFVLHGDGPATRWAAAAAPGQRLGVGGPRGSFLAPDVCAATLLAGDEAALPAIARRLEEMPPDATALVFIEVEDAAEQQNLRAPANATIAWLHREGIPAGRSALLEAAIADCALPAGQLEVWLAGEIDAIRSLRRHLVEARGVPRAQIRAAGYWRLGAADAHARIED